MLHMIHNKMEYMTTLVTFQQQPPEQKTFLILSAFLFNWQIRLKFKIHSQFNNNYLFVPSASGQHGHHLIFFHESNLIAKNKNKERIGTPIAEFSVNTNAIGAIIVGKVEIAM